MITCSRTKDCGIKVILISIGAFLKIIERDIAFGNMIKLKELVMPARRYDDEKPQNFCMDIIKTLWSLLDEPSDQFLIV